MMGMVYLILTVILIASIVALILNHFYGKRPTDEPEEWSDWTNYHNTHFL